MPRRKTPKTRSNRKKKINPETLVPESMTVKNADENGEESRFYACYLLTSLAPRSKATYIGFTVNPRRRIRQHNGEITSGACKTKKRRPWEMVLCIYGFPTNVSALQFEWAWQHPRESKAVRQAVASFKSFTGIANKIKLAYAMLSLPPWQSLNITVNYFSTKHTSCSSGLPEHMKVQICPMDELPCYTNTLGDGSLIDEGEDEEHVSSNDNDHDSVSDSSGNADVIEGEDDKKSNDRSDTSGIAEETEAATFRVYRPTDFAGSIDTACVGRGWSWSSCSSNPSPEVDSVTNVFNFDISPPRRMSPIRSEFCAKETGDGNVLILIDGSDSKSGPVKRKERVHSAKVPHQIEVIDLLSPSPEFRMWSVSKKGRFSAAISPQIIDLT
ncbi:Structure-specific endonuclease subunit SLX1 [Linum grandiflorum]